MVSDEVKGESCTPVPAEAAEAGGRRAFIKGTLAAAGVAAAVAVTTPAARAQVGGGFFGPVKVNAAFTSPPQLADIQRLIGLIVGQAGCPTCGLLGIELNLTLGEEVQVGVPNVVVVAGSAS
jgi:hypothetical protein